MLKFSIENFGCRATEADAAALRCALLSSGLDMVREHAEADIVVLNTCTVTASADSQAREAVRNIHRANPGARIVVTGCYAQRAPEELAALGGVAWVIGNSHQTEIPGIAAALQSPAAWISEAPPGNFVPLAALGDGDAFSLARGPAKILTGDIFARHTMQIAPAAPMAGGRTRPILKIQDGCNNRCSYCVIPFVRGRSRSLAPDTVIAEIRRLIEAGAKEVVLSGINLGSYGRDTEPKADLAAVVRRIFNDTDLPQLRFSSIEPQDVTEDFVALAASTARVAPHFHVPLQSGSNQVLRAMRRRYRAEHYAERVKLIRRRLPDAAIGADVIAGFPGETEAEFRSTVEFIEGLPLTYLHVFSFSARPGTKGAKLMGVVPPRTIRERASLLRGLSVKKTAAFRASQAGRTVRALTLARSGDNWTEALTANYLKVRVPGQHPANEWRDAFITGSAPDGVIQALGVAGA